MLNFDEELVDLARDISRRAYAPYSQYRVGAAIRTANGNIFVGTNVENISFGATICAERSAICAMVAAGELEILRIAIHTRDGGTPCGICLQSIAEFSPEPDETEILLVTSDQVTRHTLRTLAPLLFRSSAVAKNKMNSES